MAITRQDLEELQRELMSYAIHKLGEDIGITLVLSTFGESGYMSYISNVDREDMIKCLEEWIAKVKAGLSTDPLGPKAEA